MKRADVCVFSRPKPTVLGYIFVSPVLFAGSGFGLVTISSQVQPVPDGGSTKRGPLLAPAPPRLVGGGGGVGDEEEEEAQLLLVYHCRSNLGLRPRN
ncbi:hypothetical protein GUJ93_ZPchr0001g33156 [Zizania palustris]|uniref:Uncharacterized protein n=1 Tax=Zizania palustris TaxID=103762 RepID=A0A8J5RZL4_ZIZPA|nr:hypothetical protein GUJ93_ZPchr0001g33156 [Zizania palustris]